MEHLEGTPPTEDLTGELTDAEIVARENNQEQLQLASIPGSYLHLAFM